MKSPSSHHWNNFLQHSAFLHGILQINIILKIFQVKLGFVKLFHLEINKIDTILYFMDIKIVLPFTSTSKKCLTIT